MRRQGSTVPGASDQVVLRMESETDLFGNPVATLQRADRGKPPVNDMNLVEMVIRSAATEKFVLVGPGEKVFRRTTGSYVERVESGVECVVHQLIEARWFDVGGTHTVYYERYEGPARSVLVPRKTRQAAARWGNLQRPNTWNSSTKAAQNKKGA